MKTFKNLISSLILILCASTAFAVVDQSALTAREAQVRNEIVAYLSAPTWDEPRGKFAAQQIENLGVGNRYKRANENAIMLGNTVDALPEEVKNSPLFRQKLISLVYELNPNSDPLEKNERKGVRRATAFFFALTFLAIEYPHQPMSHLASGLQAATYIIGGATFDALLLMNFMDMILRWQEPKIRVSKELYARLVDQYCSEALDF